jgi:DNA-binding transcriptional regulator LsrR (DeoR family)
VDETERDLLARIARRFYLEDMSKTELAEAFRMSRFRIARLLEQAREEGIVKIQIEETGLVEEELSSRLAAHLRLDDCIVVPAGETEEDNRQRLARAAATYITSQTHRGDVIGFSWGRTLAALGQHLGSLPPCTILQLTGTVGNDLTRSPVEVIRRIADRAEVSTVALLCPLFAASATTAALLREDPAIHRTMALYPQLALAVLSVGSWDPPITQLTGFFSPQDRAELTNEHAKAEMAGIFVRDDGSLVDAAVVERRISVSVPELLGTPRVLAVAGSVEKVGAIAAVVRSGLVTALITDDRAASALLGLPGVAAHALDRPSAARS